MECFAISEYIVYLEAVDFLVLVYLEAVDFFLHRVAFGLLCASLNKPDGFI